MRQLRSALRLLLPFALLALLALVSLASLSDGLLASRGHTSADLLLRAREYAAIERGVYPFAGLGEGPDAANVPTSVYPPYAVLLFGLFFAGGGVPQAWLLVHGLSLLSLALISGIGWRSLRFAGPAAGLLGALAPLAISGNGNCLFHGQFSILCMGLVSLQWLLQERRRPLTAGLCWALSMLKPQIGAAFALPLLARGQRRGLALGVALLVGLSAVCLALTGLSPLRYLAVWGEPGLLRFTRSGGVSLMALVGPATVALLAPLALVLHRLLRQPARAHRETEPSPQERLRQMGLAALLGALGFYHLNYDNIMVFPALLAVLSLALRQPSRSNRILAVAMALSLWFPVHLTADRPLPQALIALTWLLAAVRLLVEGPETTKRAT